MSSCTPSSTSSLATSKSLAITTAPAASGVRNGADMSTRVAVCSLHSTLAIAVRPCARARRRLRLVGLIRSVRICICACLTDRELSSSPPTQPTNVVFKPVATDDHTPAGLGIRPLPTGSSLCVYLGRLKEAPGGVEGAESGSLLAFKCDRGATRGRAASRAASAADLSSQQAPSSLSAPTAAYSVRGSSMHNGIAKSATRRGRPRPTPAPRQWA